MRPPRVGIVTTTGGGAAMVFDQLGIPGIVVGPPSPAKLARLAAANLPATPGRVLDVTLAGAKYEIMMQLLSILLDAPEFDLVVTVVGSSARLQPARNEAAFISEADAYEVLKKLDVPCAPAAKMPRAKPPRALPFAFLVVAKVRDGHIPHKTEIEGVVLGIRDEAGLHAAFETQRRNLAERAPGIDCRDALVQTMHSGLMEVLIGYRVDPDAGPLVMLAAGGIWAGVARDRGLRLAPVTGEAAHAMIAQVKALRALEGLRRRPRGDLDALARAALAFSQLALQPQLGVWCSVAR